MRWRRSRRKASPGLVVALAVLLLVTLMMSELAAQVTIDTDSVASVVAEEPPPSQSPPGMATAGDRSATLVLSGGGSRGLAHAGALAALEDLGYRPDVVVGTSMGALVGALYAAGYTPLEIQQEILAVDWGETFTPAPLIIGPERIARYPLLDFDSDPDSARFNRGLVPEWRINRALTRLLFDAGARSGGDFDNLARRYRAATADISTGELVVLESGDLARAVRASFAVPGFFAPVEMEGRFLVDGGLADNLPVMVARELDPRPDRIIAVDVRIPSEDYISRAPLGVANRAIDLLMRNARQDTLPADFLIRPDIPPSVTGVVFPPDAGVLFELGYDAAIAGISSPPESDPAEPPSLPPRPRAFSALRVESADSALASLVRRVFSAVAPGPYDPEAVRIAVDRLYTTGFFEAVWPRVEPGEEDDAPVLVVRADGPPRFSLAAALGYDSDRGARIWSTLQRQVTLVGAPAYLSLGGSFNALDQWAELSARALFPAWPVLGWSGGLFAQETDVRRFDMPAAGDQEVVRSGSWVGLEIQESLSARVAMIALKGEWIGVEDERDGFVAGPLVRFSIPTAKVPIVGVQAEAEVEARWGEYEYQRIALRGSQGAELGDLRVAVVADLAAASEDAPPDARPALGDERAMPGYRWGEQRNLIRAIAGADVAWPIPLQGYLRARMRAGSSVSSFDVLRESEQWVLGGELGVIWRTPFGSLSAAFGLSEGGEQNLILDIGQAF